MQHEGFVGLSGNVVESLYILAGAQGHGHQGLGLPAGEDGRSVGPGQEGHFRADGADIRKRSPVRALFFLQQLGSKDTFLEKAEELGCLSSLFFLFLRDGFD